MDFLYQLGLNIAVVLIFVPGSLRLQGVFVDMQGGFNGRFRTAPFIATDTWHAIAGNQTKGARNAVFNGNFPFVVFIEVFHSIGPVALNFNLAAGSKGKTKGKKESENGDG